jgi:hypothetical protein
MVTARNIAVLVFLLFAGVVVTFASTSSRKLIETRSYDHGWEADMAALDLLATNLQNEPNSTGYIFIYGAMRGYRNDVAIRMECMKNYMLQRRGIPDYRLRVVNGGYREYTMIELWVAPHESVAPVPRPMVRRKNVRLKRGRTKYTCNV